MKASPAHEPTVPLEEGAAMVPETDVLVWVERVHKLFPLPSTSQRVLALCARSDTTVEKVAEAVAADPALAAEVLRLANSAASGARAEITDLGRALVTIGLVRLHNMAAALAMFATFSKKDEQALGLHDRGVLAGAVARGLAGELGIERSLAFVCGLLSEIGALAFLGIDGKPYVVLYKECAGDFAERERQETARYGITARTLGGALMRKNGIPDTLARAVESDLVPSSPGTQPLGSLTAYARASAMLLSSDGAKGDAKVLKEHLAQLSLEAGLGIAEAKVIDLCLAAAGKTVTVLKRAR